MVEDSHRTEAAVKFLTSFVLYTDHLAGELDTTGLSRGVSCLQLLNRYYIIF